MFIKPVLNKLLLTRQRGMSLIEIIVILAFICVTLAVGVNIVGAQESDDEKMIRKARDGLMLINNGIGAYVFDTEKSIPKTQQELSILVEEGYFESLPTDPWGHDYQYHNPAIHNTGRGYDLYSLGPDGIESEDDIVNWDLYGKRAVRYALALEK